jgi:ABC-2 type transport system ATP-binding protein
MSAITVTHLIKKFGDRTVIDNISFSVKEGEIFGFLGPNGAGKTTTIRLITGVLTPDSGTVSIGNVDVHRHPFEAKMQMGVIPENSSVYGDLTAEQNLLLTGRMYGMPRDQLKKRVVEVLSDIGLLERRNDPVYTFSKGMKQRISIGCAIVHNPRILFLDEPTSGLDVRSRNFVMNTIRKLREDGCTIFLTTHNIAEANSLCETVCIINQGRIVASDRPDALKRMLDTTQSVEVSFKGTLHQEKFNSPEIIRAEMVGDRWRLYTDNPDHVVRFVVTLSEKENLTISSITTSGPNLEEAFIRLTGG